MNTTQFNWF